MSCVTYFIAAG